MDKELDVSDLIRDFPGARLLTQGGQKVVYIVSHPTYGRIVLKIGKYQSAQGLERIRREVQTLSSIGSKSYPKLYEFKIVDDSRFLIIEEYLDGNPLSQLLNSFKNVQKATFLIFQIAEALKILWDIQIVHRDVKPQNLIIRPDGSPAVIDLGIARLLNLDSLTWTHAPYGPCTPAYASPEQLENRKNEINHRSDQFTLGIIYGQLLTGGFHPFDPVFVGSGISIPENIISDNWHRSAFEINQLKNVSHLLCKMLGHHPHHRYRQPELLINAFKLALGGSNG